MRIAATFIITAGIIATVGGVAVFRHANVKDVLVLGSSPATARIVEGLRAGLSERGWAEGKTIRYDILALPTPFPEMEQEIRTHLTRHTDLVVALTTRSALATHPALTPLGVPLLLSPASDPVAVGLVSGNIHPGQSITGIAFAAQEARRLETLARLVPHARRIWVPFDHSDPSPTAVVKDLERTAAKLGLTLVRTDVRDLNQLRAALDALPRDIDAIFIPPDVRLSSHIRAVTTVATARHLPLTTPQRDGVEQGALFSYGFDLYTLGQQSARLADQILGGTPAADLPIETPDMQLAINLTAADLLGLPVPDDLLRHAIIIGRTGE